MINRRSAISLLSAAVIVRPTFAQAQTTLVMNSITPPSHFFAHTIMAEWQDRVATATGGEVKIEATAAPLGPMPRALDMVRTGVADVSAGNHGTIASRFPLTLITESPMMRSSPEQVSTALWRVHQEHLAAANEHEGVQLLSLWVSGGFQFFSRKEINTIDDLAGQRIITSSGVAGEIVKALGATPVSAPVSEQFELLARGVVDGTMTSQTGVTGWNLESHIRTQLHIPGGVNNQTFFLVMNQGKWDALSAEEQEAIMSVSGEDFGRFAASVFQDEEDKAEDTMKAAGVNIITLDDAAQAELHDKLDFVDVAWIEKANAAGIDGKAAIDMLRAEARLSDT